MKKKCFTNYHCSYDCPNIEIDICDDKYGYGIADDMGLKRIKCSECGYNTGECEDCLFYENIECRIPLEDIK